ncbi:MAG TPA: hypothetical protein VK835_11935, partial [Bacteroidia bacterium]|nr:hypothetical protein [Bacteroidia bacterium]
FLSAKQQSTIDSCFIFQENIKLLQKNKLLESLKPEQKYYSRIRSMVTVDHNMSAAIALSKFQNKNDIELIKKFFANSNTQYYAAYCAREFPDTLFFPLLIKMFDAQWEEKYYDYDKWRILFQALAKYPNDETIKLFKKVTETKDSFRYQTLGSYLKIAAIKYPNRLFKPFKKIKLDNFYEDQVKSQMNYE